MPSEPPSAGLPEREPDVDGEPRRTSPRTIVVSLGALIPIAAFFALTSLVGRLGGGGSSSSSGDSGGGFPFDLLIVLFGAVAALFQCIAWFARTYSVTGSQLVIDEGILSRHHRVIPYNRVQQVDVHQNLIAQIFSVAELRVSTAGEAGATTVKLVFLAYDDADRLRAYVLRRRAELQGTPAASASPSSSVSAATEPGARVVSTSDPWDADEQLLSLGVGRLLLAVISHSTLLVGAAIGAIGAVWLATWIALGGSTLSSVGAAIAAALAFLFLEALIAFNLIMRHVLGMYGYTLSVRDDDLHLRYGLLEVRNLTVPRRRVQHITIDDNPLRRALGLAAIKVKTASGTDATQHASTELEIPIIARSDVDSFLMRLMGDAAWLPPPLTPRSPVARRRAMRRRILILALLMVVPAVAIWRSGNAFGLALLLVAVLGVPWGLVAHKRAGYGQSDTAVALAHGVLHHRIDVVPIARLQSCRTHQSPFQRLSGVATFHADIAGTGTELAGIGIAGGSSPQLFDMDAELATARMRELPRASVAAHQPAAT
jgi:putative membrane protein